MPYILPNKRTILDPKIDELHTALVDLEMDDVNNNLEGNLNYIVTRLIRKCYGTSYGEINDAIGMLECVKMEHYRKVAAPYEDQKEFENGSVDGSNVPIILNEVVIENDDG